MTSILVKMDYVVFHWDHHVPQDGVVMEMTLGLVVRIVNNLFPRMSKKQPFLLPHIILLAP